jgi:hypothetical protein
MTSQSNGICQNSLHQLVLKNPNFFFLIFSCTFSVWTRDATSYFLKYPEHIWLKSACLVSKCSLKLHYFAYTLFTYHTYGATFILNKTILPCPGSWNTLFSSFNMLFYLFYFCQPWIFLKKWMVSEKTNNFVIITVSQLNVLVHCKCSNGFNSDIHNKKNHIHNITALIHVILSKLIAWFKTVNLEPAATEMFIQLATQIEIPRCTTLELQVMAYFIWNTNSWNFHKLKDHPLHVGKYWKKQFLPILVIK